MKFSDILDRYINELKDKPTKELAEMYNMYRSTWDSRRREYRIWRACEEILISRGDEAMYDSHFDRYAYWDGERYATP